MYRVLVFLVVALATTVDSFNEKELLSQDDIDYINSSQNSWVASKKWVGSMTAQEFQSMLSPIPTLTYPKSSQVEYEGIIPNNFDSRIQWPNCTSTIGTQGTCAAGFAFASAASLSYRLCIGSSRYTGIVLSPQYLINCGGSLLTCKAGLAHDAWDFLLNTGTGLNSCIPYTGIEVACPIACSNGTPVTIFKSGLVNTYTVATSIQNAIMANGPIVSTMTVYPDFASYTSGIYVKTGGAPTGAQNVMILGWGLSGTTNYWICANSFGTGWGIQGFFWIQFGQCGIDYGGVAGMPTN